MTNVKSTKRALLTSVMALFLCFAMLLGTTYAWFTDSVTSANNVIKSGNLDITLEYWNGNEWKDVEGSSDILKGDLWEPGYTDVAYLRIKNAGSLDLKYQLGVNIISETEGKTKDGETITLSDYIYFDVVEGIDGETAAYKTREDAMAVATETKLISAGYSKEDTLVAGSDYVCLAMVVYMPTWVGNDANHDGVNIPRIDLGINIIATQVASENDGMGNNKYDEDAWHEVVETPVDVDENGVAEVWTAPQLAWVMNNLDGIKTIEIMENINLGGLAWNSADLWNPENCDALTINGNGHTISNMTVSGQSNTGFIGRNTLKLTIKDLTFEGANVTASGSYAGVVIGYQYGDVVLNNVDVVDSKVVTTNEKGISIGGLVGFSVQNDGAKLTLENCDVTNTQISGYHSLGGFVGVTKKTDAQDTLTINNCTSSATITYSATDGVGGHDYAAGVDGYTDVIFTGSANDVTKSTIKVSVSAAENLQAALNSAKSGATIVIVKDIANAAVTVDKSLTITGDKTLNNVSITASGTDVELTVSELTFTGNSWINANNAKKLTVSGVTAKDLTTSNGTATNAPSAFIALGKSEQNKLELVVENCNIVLSAGISGVLGWAQITKATITGNTFGSEIAYISPSGNSPANATKFMSISNDAVFTITGNTVYTTSNGFAFYQNTTRDNAYTVYVDGNDFHDVEEDPGDHIWVEINGTNTTKATIKATSNNTVNGETFTAADIKSSSRITTWTNYAGVDVVTDENGKLTGGTFVKINEDCVADGYKAVALDGVYVVVDEKIDFVSTAVELENALKADNYAVLTCDITMEAHLTSTNYGDINIDGAGHTLTIRGIYGVSGANVTLSNMTLVDNNLDDYIIYNQGGKVELTNVTYNGTNNKAFQLAGGGEVVLNNCNITGEVTGTYSASNIWCGDGRTVTVNGGTYGSIFMNVSEGANVLSASKITVNDGTISKLILETEINKKTGDGNSYKSAVLVQNGGTIDTLVENPQNIDLTGKTKLN